MADTTHLSLPLLAAAQAQKHVTHNEALLRLDAIVQLSVIDRDLTDPPAEPNDGDRYIPASGATGAWADWDLNIAWFVDGVWTKLTPREGWRVWVEDEDVLLVWDGAAWQPIAVDEADPPTVQVFTESATWDKPTGCRKVRVTVRGGGGGGGGTLETGAGTCSVGGGGAQGGLSVKWIDVTAISSVAVTVGSGGGGGPSSTDLGTSKGSSGGTSSFGAHCSATGGEGGDSSPALTQIRLPKGGEGGAGADGDLNEGGISGGIGIGLPSDNRATGGPGGGGGAGVGAFTNTEASGTDATGFGAGGGGGAKTESQSTGGEGGAGKSGFVLVEEFY